MILASRNIFGFLIATLIGGVLMAGVWEHGHRKGIAAGMKDSFYGQILHANQALSALQGLKHNKTDATRYSLEVGLKLSVVMLAPEDRLAMMNDKTREDAMQTLAMIKQYRLSNPLEGEDDASRRRVERLLESVPDSPTSGASR